MGLAPSELRLPTSEQFWSSAWGRFRTAQGRPVLLDRDKARAISQSHPDQAHAVVLAAERVREGRFGFFGYPEVTVGLPPDWNHDPVTDFTWPATASDRIDHRSAGADPKWIWELNRLQFLPWLAQAWLLTDRAEFSETAFDLLDSWVEQNPAGRGIAWRGAFEPGIRAISVLVALQGLRDSPHLTAARFRSLVTMLGESAERCWRDRSRFSSANNHLVGELAGLATVALLLPDLPQAPRWRTRALAGLAVEAERQIRPDGTGAEQAVGYQLFTAELLLVVSVLARSGGIEAPEELAGAVLRSAELLAAVETPADPPLRYGDDDEGFALRLDDAAVRTVADHVAIVAAALGADHLRRRGHRPLAALWWEQSTQVVRRTDPQGTSTAIAGNRSGNMFAADGGLVVLRSPGRRVTMDVGPLGYLSLAAHGHADALAVDLSLGGQPLIGDPGTGSYYGHPSWRVAHRGTRMHATVTVDDEDQSVMGGAFLWTRHATTRVRSVDLSAGRVDAEHDGYRRLADPVLHRRWLIAPADEPAVVVVDLLEGRAEHHLRVSWPLHPSLDAAAHGSGHLITRGDVPVLQMAAATTLPAGLDVEQVRGDSDTQLGWWSERLESRTPSWLLSTSARGECPAAIVTVLRSAGVEDPDPLTDVAVVLNADVIRASWSDAGHSHDVVLPLR